MHQLWAYIVKHPIETEIAAVLALIFAVFFGVIIGVIFESLDIGSRLRAGIRRIKNKFAERSAARLGKRINELETQRDNHATYLGSDKALYLATFRIVIAILMLIILGAIFTVFSHIFQSVPVELFAFLFYFIAFIAAIQGLTISSLDTRAKVSAVVTKLDSEISELKTKLEAISK
jgi:bacteriorhodopsin